MTIARNMTLFVLLSSLTMFAAAIGCGERSSGGPSPEPSAGLAAATERAGAEEETPEGKTEATPVAQPADEATVEPSEEPALEPSETEGPELHARDGLSLARLLTARDVVDHEPVGATSSFDVGEGRIYAFIEAASTRGEEAAVEVTFERPDGRSVGHVELTIPAHVPRWRTWAYSRLIDEPGEWQAVVRTTEGEVLGRTAFHVD